MRKFTLKIVCNDDIVVEQHIDTIVDHHQVTNKVLIIVDE